MEPSQQENLSMKLSVLKKPGRWVCTVALAGLAMGAQPSVADHGLPHVEQLARGTFFDDVAVQVRSRAIGAGARVLNLRDASDLVVLRITIEPGGIAPWHGHTGTGLLVNMGPGTLTNMLSDDCMPRQYLPGDAFIDPGHGVAHAVRNDSEEEVLLFAIFVGVEEGPPVHPEPGPPPCPFLE
jgi:quercetin dioxygenase-like cupin family protein